MIKVAILDDHQSIVDGYLYRLKNCPWINVVGAAKFVEDLHFLLARQRVDVLLMDVYVPLRVGETSPYPILNTVREILKMYPDLNILVISMIAQPVLIKSLVDIGVSGYVFKHDTESIGRLGDVISVIAGGGIYFSQQAHDFLRLESVSASKPLLTDRQLEALGLCAAYPDLSTAEIAVQLGVAHSTLRNLLSGAYLRLNVHTRIAAITRARQLGLLSDSLPEDV